MPTFEIVCLANSRKWQGRCVAGLRTDGTGWMRPIGAGENGVLHSYHYMLADNTEARILDVLRIECSRSASTAHHPEDWLAVPAPWQLVSRPANAGQIAWLRGLLTDDPFLQRSSKDRIAYEALQARPIANSLALVAPENLQWEVRAGKEGGQRANGEGNGHKNNQKEGGHKIRACFALGGRDYNLALTDRLLESRLQHLPIGLHPRQKARIQEEDEIWLTLSLSEPFTPMEGGAPYCYKLVAAVITVPTTSKVSVSGRNHQGTRQDAAVSTIARGSGSNNSERTAHTVAVLDPFAYPDPFAHFDPMESLIALRAELAAKPKSELKIELQIEPQLEVSAWHKKMTIMRQTFPRAYMPWTKAEDVLLKQLMTQGAEVSKIAAQMERHEGAIRSRIKKFEC